MITKLIEDKNYQKEIFENINSVFQNNKSEVFGRKWYQK